MIVWLSRRTRGAERPILWVAFLLIAMPVAHAAPRDLFLWPFSAESPWNRAIGSGAVFSAGDNAETHDLLDGPQALIHAGTWSMPIYLAAANDPWVRVHDVENKRDFRAQVPPGARPDPMGDRHMFVVEPAKTHVLEMYGARIRPDGSIETVRAFRVDLRGPGMFLKDGHFPGVRAMDASGMGGVIRAWEIRAHRIAHVMTFLLPYARLRHGPVWPSSREDYWGFRDYHGHVPIGALIAIPPEVRIETLGLSPDGLVLARALQDYGAYCDDSVGTDGIVLSAEGAAEGMPELAAMRLDFPVIRMALRVVLNNTPATPGGGGKPRQPVPPP